RSSTASRAATRASGRRPSLEVGSPDRRGDRRREVGALRRPGTRSMTAPGRWAGVLLHPTSLPVRFGIGDLGPAADRFLDWLARAGQTVWQVLPLGPVDMVGSPYGTASAFAGNPLLISPERLLEDGLLAASDLDGPAVPAPAAVDF